MKRILVLFASIALFTGCYYDKAEKLYVTPATADSCSLTNVSFSATVQPIIAQNCAISGCHDASSSNGYILTNYTNIAAEAANGQLVGTISHSGSYPQMPLSGSLTTCQINTIKAWVTNNYPNN